MTSTSLCQVFRMKHSAPHSVIVLSVMACNRKKMPSLFYKPGEIVSADDYYIWHSSHGAKKHTINKTSEPNINILKVAIKEEWAKIRQPVLRSRFQVSLTGNICHLLFYKLWEKVGNYKVLRYHFLPWLKVNNSAVSCELRMVLPITQPRRYRISLKLIFGQ